MNILIDADGCPVVGLTLQIAKQFSVPVIILCDVSHQIEREGAQTLVFDKGSDSVDFALVNRVNRGYCRNTGLRAGQHVSCQVRTSAEPKRSGIHRRQYRRSYAAAIRKQKASPCRKAPQGEPKADEGAGCQVCGYAREDPELQPLIHAF